MTVNFKLKRRDDLIPPAVALQFRFSGSWGGANYVLVAHDIAATLSGAVVEGIGTAGALQTVGTFASGSPAYVGGAANSALMQALADSALDPGAVRLCIDFEGNSNKIVSCKIATLGVDTQDPSINSGAQAFWGRVFPEFLSLPAWPSFFQTTAPTVTVDAPGVTGLPTGYNDGDPVDLTNFQYLLTDGQIPPWMFSGNSPTGTPVQVIQAKISGHWAVNEAVPVVPSAGGAAISIPTAVAPAHLKTARVTLVNIPGGLYQAQTSVTPGEIAPYGLAGYIHKIASIPQYEGTITIQEAEVSDVCPMGNNLNLTGSVAEWSGMNAQVSSISYDLVNARTTITVGPAAHLGAKDLVERLRANRYPIRPYYGIGGNIANDPNQNGGAQLGNSVAQRGPSPGARIASQQFFHDNLQDLADHPTAYPTGLPGITLDSRFNANGVDQPNYGGNGALGPPSVATIHLQEGTHGTVGRWCRISLAELPEGVGAWFQPINICQNVGGVPTTKTIYVLCTAPA